MAGAAHLQISVNVAARQLEQADFVDQVAEVVRSSGVDPARVVLEVTETTLLQNAEDAIAKLQALRDLGLEVAVDDFGTGYSSLSYLQRFPVTAIKIARDFVAVDDTDAAGWELASAIVSMGRALHLTVIAEGVEEPFQLLRLRKLRCGRAQGYYLARPLPVDEIERLFAGSPSTVDWWRTSPTALIRARRRRTRRRPPDRGVSRLRRSRRPKALCSHAPTGTFGLSGSGWAGPTVLLSTAIWLSRDPV